MPLFSFQCNTCEAVQENVLIRNDSDLAELKCGCGSTSLTKLVSAHGGYSIKGYNGASQRPKRAGSFGGGK